MPRFDPDTIAALAEGRLDPERAKELEREVAADPAAAAELAAHRLVLGITASSPTPTLTADERTLMRASIASALGLEQPQPGMAEATHRRIPWAAISVAAAALVGLVAIAPLANLLSTGGDDAATSLGAFYESTTTQPAGVSEADASLSAEGTTSGSEEPPMTSVAAATTTTAAATTMADTTRDLVDAAEIEARVRELFDGTQTAGTDPKTPEDDDPCLAEGKEFLDDTSVLTLTFDADNGISVIVFYTVDAEGMVEAVGYDSADCSVLVTIP